MEVAAKHNLGLKKKQTNEGKPIVMEVPPLSLVEVYDQWKIHW